MHVKRLIIPISISLFAIILGGCFSGAEPKNIGVAGGKLKPCPDSPNCVSTQEDPADSEHYMEPLQYTGSQEAAMASLIELVNSLPRTKIITQDENYLHVVFRTRVMRFVDDVEFYIEDSEKTIHFRSASRVGYSDLGVNRKRMQEISSLF